VGTKRSTEIDHGIGLFTNIIAEEMRFANIWTEEIEEIENIIANSIGLPFRKIQITWLIFKHSIPGRLIFRLFKGDSRYPKLPCSTCRNR
jgi:hypothetical protein